MLVVMESSFGLSERIREMQRAEAAPYIGMPPSPWWVPPFFGAWFAAYVGAFAFWRENGLAFVVTMMALSAGMGAFLGWLTRRYGALPMPGRGTPPPEIRREFQRYAVGAVVVAGLVACVWWWAGLMAASAAAFALVTAGLSLYQARYERAAAVVRERLA
ncbi:hypothetical protein [Micromonospora sp. DT31]|uniref:hypothetical protein n=1 Tax=Micromonospora sp. DT31 TaxID=3393434 RepID=UPI003CF4C8BC